MARQQKVLPHMLPAVGAKPLGVFRILEQLLYSNGCAVNRVAQKTVVFMPYLEGNAAHSRCHNRFALPQRLCNSKAKTLAYGFLNNHG